MNNHKDNGLPLLIKIYIAIYTLFLVFLFLLFLVGVLKTFKQYAIGIWILCGSILHLLMCLYLRNKAVQNFVDRFFAYLARKDVSIPPGSTILAKIGLDVAITAKIVDLLK